MIDYLNSVDTKLFLFPNGLHNSFFDPIMYWFNYKLLCPLVTATLPLPQLRAEIDSELSNSF